MFASEKHTAVNAETVEIFQRSGLSKFAAATVRLSEQKKEGDKSHLTVSNKVKNDVSFTNHD